MTGREAGWAHRDAGSTGQTTRRVPSADDRVDEAVHGSPGFPLSPGLRSDCSDAFGADLRSVRIHTDARASDAAASLDARAFTLGPNIYFGAGQFAPDGATGRRLLAHELAHVVQTRGAAAGPARSPVEVSQADDSAERAARAASDRLGRGEQVAGDLTPGSHPAGVVYRDDGDVPPGMVATVDPDRPAVDAPVEEGDEDLRTGLAPVGQRDFPLRTARSDLALLVVPAGATRADIAARLFGKESMIDVFDVEEAGGERGARARSPGLLRAEALAALRAGLEPAVVTDAHAVASILSERRIDEDDEITCVQYVGKWARRANITDAMGVQYFDRFLNALDGIVLKSFWGTEKTALEWMYDEVSEDKAIGATIAASSTHPVPGGMRQKAPGEYPAASDVKGLKRWDTVGYMRLQWPKGRMALAKPDPRLFPITVWDTLAVESDLARAETAVRNSPLLGPRIVIPGKDGKAYGFLVEEHMFGPLLEGNRKEGDPVLEDFWFIFPGTVLIRPGEFQPEYRATVTPAEQTQRAQILTTALLTATMVSPENLLGLDFDVLSTASLEQRIQMLEAVVSWSKAGQTAATDFVARVLYTTPNSDFLRLERRMSTGGITARLVRLNNGSHMLGVLGRVFTVKALASMPLGTGLGGELETFTIGKDDEGWFHFATPGAETVSSQTPQPGADDPAKASAVGGEPPLAGEPGGTFNRTAIVFYVAKVKLTNDNSPSVKSRAFLPYELVQVRILGPSPRIMVVTALEAAGLLDIRTSDLYDILVKPFVQVYTVAFAATGLLRVFGGAIAEGLMSGGLRAAVSAAGKQALTRAGTAALLDAAVLGSLAAVEGYRGELEATEAGRRFLSTYDTAMTILIARDIYHLATSGILTKLQAAGVQAWGTASATVRAALTRTLDEAEALAVAARRTKWVPGRVGTEASTGARALVPENAETFTANLRVARSEIAGRKLVSTLKSAGKDVTAAESVMGRLERVATRDVEAAGTKAEVAQARAEQKAAARAQRKIAEQAATMAPDKAQAFLERIKVILDRRRASTAALSDFLAAAADASDPIAYLTEVEKLVVREKVKGEALRVLGSKARTGTLDLPWLNRTSISDQMLDSIGRDPMTPWKALKAAAADPTNVRYLKWARASLRGIGAEVAFEESISKVLPGHNLADWQVEMEGSVIDYSVTALSPAGDLRALEVKGWTPDTWRKALNTYKLRSLGTTLTKEQQEVVRKIDHLIGQLQDARAATGKAPYLAVTDALSGPVHNDLLRLLAKEAPGTAVKQINETLIKTIASNLGKMLGIPPP
jgi:hypothetical protein